MSSLRASISEVLEHCGAELPEYRDGWVSVTCPFHDDSHSSGSMNVDEGLFKCHGCQVSGDALHVLMKAYDLAEVEALRMLSDMNVTQTPSAVQQRPEVRRSTKGRDLLLAAVERYQAHLNDASDYLKGRGITRTAAQEARLGVVRDPLPGHEPYRGRLCIPYLTTSAVVNLKFRCIEDHVCKDHGHPKYLGLHGETRMYHVTSALTNLSYIAVTEGEIDALILNHMCGIPAVGIPGANTWKPHYTRVLEGFDRIFVLGDGDKAGAEFARSVSKKLEGGISIVLPEGQDVNDVYRVGGVQAVKNLMGV